MSLSDKILVKLYFPHFNSPTSSRFESLFIYLKKSDGNKKNDASYIIFPERIIRGEDKRTSILIKNIPKNIKKKEIRGIIEKFANINFLGITQDKKLKSFIVAYLNVINYKSIVPIFMGLRNYTFNYNNQRFVTELFYSKFQGREQLRKIFKKEKWIIKIHKRFYLCKNIAYIYKYKYIYKGKVLSILFNYDVYTYKLNII